MSTKELSHSPSMLGLFSRAGLAMIPGATRLPVVGGSRAQDVPDLTLTLEDVTIERDRVAAYNRVCAFALRDTLAVTYPHMLAFPLQLSLMTDPSFPFRAIGLVHIFNRIIQHRPVRLTERLSLRVWATPLAPHPRGTQFSLRTEARVDDELVWEEVSTNLRRGGSSRESDGADDARAPDVPSAEALPPTATWSLPGDLGRRYASVSGDINPIHIHSLTAKLFGFPTAIAHGMWTKARCLAALESRLPDAYTVEVAFRKPILLPATVQFASQEIGDGGIRFGVRDARKDTPHLDGALGAAG